MVVGSESHTRERDGVKVSWWLLCLVCAKLGSCEDADTIPICWSSIEVAASIADTHLCRLFALFIQSPFSWRKSSSCLILYFLLEVRYHCCGTQSSMWALCLRSLEEPWRQSCRRLDWQNNRLLLRHHNALTALKYIQKTALYLVGMYIISWSNQDSFSVSLPGRYPFLGLKQLPDTPPDIHLTQQQENNGATYGRRAWWAICPCLGWPSNRITAPMHGTPWSSGPSCCFRRVHNASSACLP
jgi:hypothetical protein